jgi:Rrf2 family protein
MPCGVPSQVIPVKRDHPSEDAARLVAAVSLGARFSLSVVGLRYKARVISVTSKSRYAVVAMAELARSGDRPVPIAQVAERRGMPVQFLEQLFSTLRRDGLLQSQRGVKGGYTLARPADRINVLEVVQSLDGKLGDEASEAGGIWAEGVESLREVFRSTTIADIARREAEDAGSRMYYI